MRAIRQQESGILIRIVIPSARFWREESAVFGVIEMQIPRFARDDSPENCFIVKPIRADPEAHL